MSKGKHMPSITASVDLLEDLRVTLEICDRVLSDRAQFVFVEALQGYPEAQVMAALARCRKEFKGTLTPRDVIDRLDDGRPSADEAWAMVPKNERDSAIWSDEMAHGWSIAEPAWMNGDRVGAHRAFRDAYTDAVYRNRDQRRPTNWTVTLGDDRQQAFNVIQHGLRCNKLSITAAMRAVPDLDHINTKQVLLAIAAPQEQQGVRIGVAKKVKALALAALSAEGA